MLDVSTLDLSQFDERTINQLNEYAGVFEYEPTLVLSWLMKSPCKITCLFLGNQFGKGESAIMDYWHRVNGTHPNPHKNFKPEDKIRVVRFASENLPGENVEAEVKNTQYPVLKRRFLPSWIKKDITARHPVVTVKPMLGGKPVQFEFVSYGQTVQAGAGVQRASVWIDESCPPAFFYEQLPRLLAGDGDIIVTLTPVPGNLGWEFDELFERARVIVRTQTVIDRIYQRTGERVPMHERTNSKDDIMVIMAATDDNPIYEKLAKKKSERTGRIITVNDYITDILGMMDDEDMVDARRYGMFKQLSGKLFKSFTERTHVIPFDHYFPDGIPHDWKHFRGIDWHESTPWACGWIAVSPHDEIFVYNEFNPSPEKMITAEIMRVIATRSQDYKFDLNLVDPLAAKIQPNTGISSLEDMNRIMAAYKREGLGTGGYWMVWDTKSQKGRDEIRKRLMNSAKVGKPFNNMVIDGARKEYLPTIWFTDNCRQTILSLKNWRREEWANTKLNSYKEEKETPQQKWSHFCTMLEGLLKRPEVFQARFRGEGKKRLPLY